MYSVAIFIGAVMQTFSPPPDVPNPRALGPGWVAAHQEIHDYAEIGVLFGETVCRTADAMKPGGVIHLFDFEDMLANVRKRIKERGLHKKHAYIYYPCTRKLKDSYNWALLQLYGDSRPGVFDYVFLDGAHTFDVDALAFFLIDRLLKPGGLIEFDDYKWTIARSPTVNPAVFPPMAEWYTEEQIETPHIKMIVDLLVDRDPRYEAVEKGRLYRKRTQGCRTVSVM